MRDHHDPYELLRALTDDEPCRTDHHGYCQDHLGSLDDGSCAVAAARRALADKARVAEQAANPRAVDLRADGLLWYLNRVALHPRGYALAMVYEDGIATGFELLGDGSEPWRYAPEVDEDDLYSRVEALFHRLTNTP